MNKKKVYFGCDVSKGYVELHVADDAGRTLQHCHLQDVPDGHRRLGGLLTSHAGESEEVVFAVEATGGYERNWLASACRVRDQTGGRVKVYQVNGLAIKRFLERDLHRNVTDKSSAVGICSYVRQTEKLGPEYVGTEYEGLLVLYRLAQQAVSEVATLKTQLIMLLSSTAPELVRYTRNGIPDWLIALLCHYGSASELANTEPADLRKYVKRKVDPVKLIAATKTSVASMADVASAFSVKQLANQLAALQKVVYERKAEVVRLVQHREDFKRVRSIKGFGSWTAAVVVLEVRGFDRFKTAEAVSAFGGLDPRLHESGDGKKRPRISRRGSWRLRAALYMPAQVAARHNPVLRDFYQRLVSNGKPKQLAIVAVMRKLLVLAWACGRTNGQPFSATYEVKRQAEPTARRQETTAAVLDEAAPVSRRAFKRNGAKKAGSTPQRVR